MSGVIAALGSVKLPAFVSTVLADAQLLLPVVETAVGMLVPMAPDAASVATARARLQALAASRT